MPISYTLGGLTQHIYVTRKATLEYQKLTEIGFEQTRRALTERLLDAVPDRQLVGWWTFHLPHPTGMKQIRAYVVREGMLLVVANLTTVSAPEPLTEFAPVEYTERPAKKRITSL